MKVSASEVERIFRQAPGRHTDTYLRFRDRFSAREVQVGGVRWEYISGGRGEECLLLLAGGARFADTWFGLASEFEDKFRVLATTDPGVPTMEELVEGTRGILEKEGIRKVHVIGTSFGGLVAQCFTRSHFDRVLSMILSNTLVPSTIPARSIAIALKLASIYPTFVLQRAVKWNMLLLMSRTNTARKFWKAFWQLKSRTHLRCMTREQALSQYQVALDVANRYRFSQADLDSWQGSVCLIESADDIRYIRRAQPVLRELYPNAIVHRFPKGGHTPGYSDPVAYARIVRSFLEKNKTRR